MGNKTATFPLQLLGFEVNQLNTLQFSNHAQYPVVKGFRTTKAQIAEILEGLNQNKITHSHILTGYVGSGECLQEISNFIAKVKKEYPNTVVLVDPVLGDNGRLYCPEECIKVYREMISNADIITPNGFEAEILTGILATSTNIAKIMIMLHEMGPRTVIVTSVLENKNLSLYASDGQTIYEIAIPLIGESFTGTGDTFSALLIAHLNSLPLKDACLRAVDTMIAILRKTIEIRAINASGMRELAIVQSRDLILNPPVLVKSLEHHLNINAKVDFII